MRLTTDAQLAEQFGITVDKLHALRKQNSWPFVRLGRFDIRFTDAQIAQIVDSQTVAPSGKKVTAATGLTGRSAARRSA